MKKSKRNKVFKDLKTSFARLDLEKMLGKANSSNELDKDLEQALDRQGIPNTEGVELNVE